MLVLDGTDDLLENVLQRHQPHQGAVFVDHQGEVFALLPEGVELVEHFGGLGDEPGFAAQRVDVDRGGVAIGLVQRAGNVAHMEDADDVLGIALVDRQPGMRAVQRLGDDFRRRLVGIDHHDGFAVHHDVVDGQLAQVEHAAEHVAVVLHHAAFLVVQGDGAAQFVMGGKHRSFHIGAEHAQRAAHHELHRTHDRREYLHHQQEGPGDGQREPVGVGQGVGLGHDLGEDKHQDRHDQGRPEHGIAAQQVLEQLSGDHGGGDVDEIVAEQDRAEQAFAVADQAVHHGGAGMLVPFHLQHARPGCGGQRGLGAGKEGGQA